MARKTYPTPASVRKAARDLEALLAKIAEHHLDIETLEEQKMDDLDFHNVSVWGVERALRAAYEAGKADGKAAK